MAEETVAEKSNKGLMIGSMMVLLLLMTAAFMGVRLLAAAQETAELPSGVLEAGEVADLALRSGDSPEGAQMFNMPLPEAAPELPTSPPETTGVVVDRIDDTLTVGTGSIMAQISSEPGVLQQFNYEGIAVDVLLTNRTKLYEDVTEFTLDSTAVQQELVQLENLNDLQEDRIIQVWGQQDGDRIVADVIVIR